MIIFEEIILIKGISSSLVSYLLERVPKYHFLIMKEMRYWINRDYYANQLKEVNKILYSTLGGGCIVGLSLTTNTKG